MSSIKRQMFMLYSRPLFRTCEIICNHAARLSEKSGKLLQSAERAKLEELDRKRMQCQRVLNRIGKSHGHVCAECKGKCCGGARERDAFTDRVLQDPDTSHRKARRKTGQMAAYKKMDNFGGLAVSPDAKPAEGFCPELTTSGCRIPYELRPIQCAAYFCGAAADQLSGRQCENGIKALAGLMKVQLKTAALALKTRL